MVVARIELLRFDERLVGGGQIMRMEGAQADGNWAHVDESEL
jgi:hypothetical protein